MPGVFVCVVGPSGAGKDALLTRAHDALAPDPRYAFPSRVVTRPSDPRRERHDSVSEQTFDELARAGAFCLSWAAHGLKYGVRRGAEAAVARGQVVIVNVSRGAVADALRRFPKLAVIEIAASEAVRAARLAGRAGSGDREIRERLARHVDFDCPVGIATIIDNSGDMDAAARRFIGHLLAIADRMTAEHA